MTNPINQAIARGDTGFEIIRDNSEVSALRCYARFTCRRCFTTAEELLRSGKFDPDEIAKRVAKRGWKTDGRSKARTMCPGCQKRHPNDVDSELQKVVPMPVLNKVLPMIQTPQPKEPTSDQRVMIRNHLDKHFDDKLGCYYDGMTDQKIADAAGVGRAVVERLREVGYGPIRMDPEETAMRGEISDLKSEASQLQGKINALAARLDKHLAGKAA